MRYRTAATALIGFTCWAGVPAARSSDAMLLQQLIGKLERENAECQVGVSFLGRISTHDASDSPQFDGALVLVYIVESCNQGNNWSTHAQVYGTKDGRAREIGANHSWSIVKGADFNDTRALIYAVDQGPSDAHCCPSEGKTIEVTVSQGRVVFRQIKAWRNKD